MSTSSETYSYVSLSQEFRSGLREIDSMPESLAKLGARRVMLVYGQNVLNKSDVVRRVETALGPLVVGRFEGVEPHSPAGLVEAARDLAAEMNPDTVISIGGGSAATIVKGLTLLISSGKDMADYRLRFQPPRSFSQPRYPLPDIKVLNVSVATTMGFSETLRKGGGFTSPDGKEKFFLAGDGRASPRLIIIDGHALATTPQEIQKGTAVGQLRGAIESVTSNYHNPIGEAYALHAIRLLNREIVSGWSDEPAQLLRIKGACYLAAQAMAATEAMGINTAIAHQVGAISKVDHGEANAVLLPHTIRFGAIEGAAQLEMVAEVLGIDRSNKSPVRIADEIAARVALICSELGLRPRLRDIGVKEEALESVAEATLGDFSVSASPRAINGPADVMKILESAW